MEDLLLIKQFFEIHNNNIIHNLTCISPPFRPAAVVATAGMLCVVITIYHLAHIMIFTVSINIPCGSHMSMIGSLRINILE